MIVEQSQLLIIFSFFFYQEKHIFKNKINVQTFSQYSIEFYNQSINSQHSYLQLINYNQRFSNEVKFCGYKTKSYRNQFEITYILVTKELSNTL